MSREITTPIARTDAAFPRPPRLHCAFAPALHPEVASVQARSVSWAEEVGLVSGDRARAKLDAAKIGWLVCRAHPEGARVPLQIAADWTTLFCLLDDHIERIEAPASVGVYLSSLLAVARGADPVGADPVQRAMADLRGRLEAAAAPAAIARVEARVAELFDAFTAEAEVRRRGRIPAHASYVPMREITVGIHVELAFGEIIDRIELSDDARARGPLPALARKACNLVGWSNDIFTYEKEMRAGEVCNLVAVIAAARGLDPREAMACAADLHDAESRAFTALSGDEAAIGHDEGARRFTNLLRRWVRGHLDWARETGRYAG